MSNKIKDAHLTKKAILIERGIIKENPMENFLHQAYLPRGFSLNLCGHCTYSCSYCPQSLKPHSEEYIKPEIVHKVFDELGDRVVYVQTSARGESLLHPIFFEFLRLIKNKNKMSYICLNTNGYMINDKMMANLFESDIDHIVFSLQTINPKLYSKITGSPHHKKVVERIINFAKTREKLNSQIFLSVQFLDYPENLPYRQEFIDFWRLYNVDIQIQPLHSWGNKINIKTTSNTKRYPCPFLWLYPTVMHNGKLTTCFADFYGEMAYGSLETESMASLWQGEKARLLREKHLEGKWNEIPMCKNCDGFSNIENSFEYREGRFTVAKKINKKRRKV